MALLPALGFPFLRKLQYRSAMLSKRVSRHVRRAPSFIRRSSRSSALAYQLTKLSADVTDGYDIRVRARSSRAVALSSAPFGALTVLEEALCLSID